MLLRHAGAVMLLIAADVAAATPLRHTLPPLI